MEPVSGIRKGPDHGVREQGSDLVVMLGSDIGRCTAAKEKNGSFVRCNLQIWPVLDLMNITGQIIETDAPARGFAQPDVLEQELGNRSAACGWFKKIQTFPPFKRRRECNVGQSGNHVAMTVARPGRCDIRNHQLRHALGGGESQHHSDFSAHGMSHDGETLDSHIVQRFEHVLRHESIGDRAMRAVSVIAQIQCKGAKIRRCTALEKTEVPGASEQPMKEDDRLRAFAPFDDMQFHP